MAHLSSPFFLIFLLTFSHTLCQLSPLVRPNSTQLTPVSSHRAKTSIVRNVGSTFVPKGSIPKRYAGTILSPLPGIAPFFFKTAVEGISFSTKIKLPIGTYDVELGFVQVSDCQQHSRIFHIYINGYKREESLDIFKLVGCSKGLVLRYNNQIVDPVSRDGLEISFETVSGVATLSFIRIRNSDKPCVPEIPVTGPVKIKHDHWAHAVPGTYPDGGGRSFVDHRGDGFFRVRLDGSGSHTHFVANGYTARITKYFWTREDTGRVISQKPKFSYDFPLGTTVIRLKVIDSVCSEHEDTTSITVTGRIQSGVICYMYSDTGVDLKGNTLTGSRRPIMSFISRTTNIRFPLSSFRNKRFAARCVFLVKFFKSSEHTKLTIDTSSSGTAHLYRGPDRISDTSSASDDAIIHSNKGLEAFEMTYRYTDLDKPPALVLKVDGKLPWKVYHDYATTLPIISSISPSSGSTAGGTEVRITGYNFFRPINVEFGNSRAVVKNDPQSSIEMLVNSPPRNGNSVVSIRVHTIHGYYSNSVRYRYGNTCDDVKFDTTYLVNRSGKKVVVNQPTAVTMSHEGDLFVATLEGRIHKISYDHETAVVKSMCYSEIFKDYKWQNTEGEVAPRAFLGIALNPKDRDPKPYVSASTLLYFRRNKPIATTNPFAWSNGAVERFKRSSAEVRKRDPKQCLQHDKNIVQGLPVANGDHVVSELLFSQYGDLLIAVGAHTNMGLPNLKLGGLWESYFSGAIVIAKVSRAGFQGKIPYTTPTNLRTARPKGEYKDVDLYATGFRNAFAMTMSRTGIVYAGDNGPNRGFGDAASSCNEYNETEAAARSFYENVPGGGAIVGSGNTPYSDNRPDKIVWVKKGKFYGQPNLQRSVLLGVDQCAYIDPLTNKSPPPAKKAPPANYERPLTLVRSPTTDIIEYGGNEFCGKARGTLIIAKLKSSGTYAVSLRPDGRTNGEAYKFNRDGGMSVVEDSTGSLIFPKFVADPTDGFVVLRPHVADRDGLYISGAVPFRHGRKGKTKIHIGGRGFLESSVVKIGKNTCVRVSLTSTKIVCQIPAYTGGPVSVDLTVTSGGQSAVLKKAVLYMEA